MNSCCEPTRQQGAFENEWISQFSHISAHFFFPDVRTCLIIGRLVSPPDPLFSRLRCVAVHVTCYKFAMLFAYN
eukprot:g25836.t1